MEDLKHPLLKVPFENANKSFRLLHKHVTREISAFDKLLNGLHEHSTDETITTLTSIAEKIRSVQVEAERFIGQQEQQMQVSVDRTMFLQQPMNTKIDDNNIHHDRLIADYLLGAGHVNSAKHLIDTKGLTSLVDYDLHLECRSILNDLKSHNLSTAITWCIENGSRLRRLQSQFEFKVRLQAFLELVRSDCKIEAIQYAQSHLTPLSMQYEDVEIQKRMMEAIQEAMVTLAYKTPSHCTTDTYAKLFSEDRWEMLQQDFRNTFCEVYGIHNPSSLWIALYAGLSSLNTRMCRRTRDSAQTVKGTSSERVQSDETKIENRSESNENKRQNESQSPQKNKKTKLIKLPKIQVASNCTHHSAGEIKNEDHCTTPPLCPTCSDIGSQLVEGLPFAHHPHSRLVCRITETVMDHSNPPFVLPNGHVYSRQAIDRLAKDAHVRDKVSGSNLNSANTIETDHSKTPLRNDGIIICPQTQESYSVADVKPVYII